MSLIYDNGGARVLGIKEGSEDTKKDVSKTAKACLLKKAIHDAVNDYLVEKTGSSSAAKIVLPKLKNIVACIREFLDTCRFDGKSLVGQQIAFDYIMTDFAFEKLAAYPLKNTSNLERYLMTLSQHIRHAQSSSSNVSLTANESD